MPNIFTEFTKQQYSYVNPLTFWQCRFLVWPWPWTMTTNAIKHLNAAWCVYKTKPTKSKEILIKLHFLHILIGQERNVLISFVIFSRERRNIFCYCWKLYYTKWNVLLYNNISLIQHKRNILKILLLFYLFFPSIM